MTQPTATGGNSREQVGQGAQDEHAPCEGYKPTIYELRLLARHWKGELVARRLQAHFDGCYGGWRQRAYAGSRLDDISSAIGEAAVRQESDRVWDDVSGGFGPHEWQAFWNDNQGELRRIAGERHDERSELEAVSRDESAASEAWGHLRERPQTLCIDAKGYLWHLYAEPGPQGPAGDRLRLCVLSRRGFGCFVPGYEMEVPAGWVPPYGLH
jgi:hypothetical protein